MNIVILDGYTENPGDLSWDEFKKHGELTVHDRTLAKDIVPRLKNADIVFTNKTPISRSTLDACPRIKFIGVLATGYNIVDVQAAKEKGILVTNIPTYGTDAVAQFTIALLLELCHHIGNHSDCVKKGDWTNCQDWCFWNYPLVELSGKTLGVIGFGRIGQKTAQIAQAMGMKILAYDPYPIQLPETDTLKHVCLDDLLEHSDVITLHCPLFSDTKGIISKETIAKMKDGVMIINASRGALIVEEDLSNALNRGKIAGAACDVVSTEPIQMDNPLITAQNMILTPHIAWAPKESRQRLMDIAVNNLAQYLSGFPINVVNP